MRGDRVGQVEPEYVQPASDVLCGNGNGSAAAVCGKLKEQHPDLVTIQGQHCALPLMDSGEIRVGEFKVKAQIPRRRVYYTKFDDGRLCKRPTTPSGFILEVLDSKPIWCWIPGLEFRAEYIWRPDDVGESG